MRDKTRWFLGLMTLLVIPARAGRLAQVVPLPVCFGVAVVSYTFAIGFVPDILMLTVACECHSWREALSTPLLDYLSMLSFCAPIGLIIAVVLTIPARLLARTEPLGAIASRTYLLAAVPAIPWVLFWGIAAWVFGSVSGGLRAEYITLEVYLEETPPAWLRSLIWPALTFVLPFFALGAWVLAINSARAACREPLSHCMWCKYDLMGIDAYRCPECGANVVLDPVRGAPSPSHSSDRTE